MFGRDIGSLLVLTSSRGIDHPVFSRSYDQGNSWREAVFSAKITNKEKVDLMFEITRCPLSQVSGYLLQTPHSWTNAGVTEDGHCQGVCRPQWFFYIQN